MINASWPESQVACLHRNRLRGAAVAVPVGEAVDLVADAEALAPKPKLSTTPEISWQGITGVRSWPLRSIHVDGHWSSPGL
jgi:hypothetical protein